MDFLSLVGLYWLFLPQLAGSTGLRKHSGASAFRYPAHILPAAKTSMKDSPVGFHGGRDPDKTIRAVSWVYFCENWKEAKRARGKDKSSDKKKKKAKEKRGRKKWHKWVTSNSTFICRRRRRWELGEAWQWRRQKPTPHMPRCSSPFSYNLNIFEKKSFHLAVMWLWVWGVFLCATEHMRNSEDNTRKSALYFMEWRIDLRLSVCT